MVHCNILLTFRLLDKLDPIIDKFDSDDPLNSEKQFPLVVLQPLRHAQSQDGKKLPVIVTSMWLLKVDNKI